jgi:hypothetical protein
LVGGVLPRLAADNEALDLENHRAEAGTSFPAPLSIVTLGVADVARSAAFYGALGWERASSSEEICWFRTSDTKLGLFAYDSLAADANTPAAPRAFGGITPAINVESQAAVDAAIEAPATAWSDDPEAGGEDGVGRILRVLRPIPTATRWRLRSTPSSPSAPTGG